MSAVPRARPDGEHPRAFLYRVNGVELAVYEWAGDGPALLFAHATGFHARCWDQVIRLLPGRRAIAVDLRGHGRSEKPAPPYRWSLVGDDVVALVRSLDLRGAVGVGHSMGGHSLTYAAGREPPRFGALLLVDPVIRERAAYAQGPRGVPGSSFVSRRRNEWSSAAEMVERFAGREPFRRWQPRVLRDYCEFGLRARPDGPGFMLACPPEIEADLYAHAEGTDVSEEIARIAFPVRILRASPAPPGEFGRSFNASPTDPELASRFAHAEDVLLPKATHFIPMESPDLVATHVETLIGATAG